MVAAWALGTGAASTAAHPYNLEINGIDAIAQSPMDSIHLEMAGPGTNGSLSFTLTQAAETTRYRDRVLATSGLVSYWRLNEPSGIVAADTQDSNPGTYVDGPTYRQVGPTNDVSTAIKFNGTSEYMEAADAANLDVGDVFSLEIWFKRNGSTGADQRLIHKGLGAPCLVIRDATDLVELDDPGTGVCLSSTTTVPSTDTGWHHVVVAKNAGTVARLWLDGVNVTGTLTARTFASNGTVLRIGTGAGVDTTQFFKGTVAEAAIYNVALAGQDIKEHYDAARQSPYEVTPQEWDEVRFIDNDNDRPIVFGGYVQSAQITSWPAAGRTIELECVGYGIHLDLAAVGNAGNTWPAGWDEADSSDWWAMANVLQAFGPYYCPQLAWLSDATYNTAGSENFELDPDRPLLRRDIGLTGGLLRYVGKRAWYFGLAPDAWSEPQSFRTLVDTLFRTSQLQTWNGSTGDATAIQPLLWVDAYRRVHATWDLSGVDSSYYGDAPVDIAESDAAGTVSAVVSYERDGTDRLTGAYVRGVDAASSGYVLSASLPRAGDLTEVIDDTSTITDATGRNVAAGKLIAERTGSVVRSGATVESVTPIDFRPGQKILVSNTACELVSQAFRVTGVSVTYARRPNRVYELTFGVQRSTPSAMRRIGRLTVRKN